MVGISEKSVESGRWLGTIALSLFIIQQGTITDSPPRLARQSVPVTFGFSNFSDLRGIEEGVVSVSFARLAGQKIQAMLGTGNLLRIRGC